MPQDAPPEIQSLALRAIAIERYVQDLPQPLQLAMLVSETGVTE